MSESGKKRVSLMGPPRVTAWVPQAGGGSLEKEQRISKDAEVMELLALLVLSKLFLTQDDAKTNREVRRDWLLAQITPRPNDTPKQTRDNLLHRLEKLDNALHVSTFPRKPGVRQRETVVFGMSLAHLSIDVWELAEAAKQIQVPANQEAIIALGDRPLLDGMPYPWRDTPAFQQIRVMLDTAYLTALVRQTDSQLVLREAANAAGRSAEADQCRSRVLPWLDKATERLRGYGERLGQPAYSLLAPFEAQCLALRRRAAYPLPEDVISGPPPRRVPRPITTFIGRTDEIKRLDTLLTAQRLVTLVGMGGCGKTRLAQEAAAVVEDRGERAVYWVELASLKEVEYLPQTVAKALGLEVTKDIPAALIAHFQGKPVLLVLDNCEHLIHPCADFAQTLLQACPELSILATSRETLRVDGEYLFPVPPLGIPDLAQLPTEAPDPVDALLAYDSVHLFWDHACPQRDFTLKPADVPALAAICASLDGIPLALILAAARFKTLSLDEIMSRLSDRFHLLTNGQRTALPHHKTLRAVVDWSYDLLTEPEQALLCRLSVFSGGWTLDAAEAVGSSDTLPATDVLDHLSSLVDKSLVLADPTAAPTRFNALETIRHYAQDRLRERGEWNETHRKHRNHFFQFIMKAYPQLHGADQVIWLNIVESEHDNIRASLTSYQKTQENGDNWVRMTAGLWWFWWVRGYLSEGRLHLAEALSQAQGVTLDTRARGLEGAGVLAIFQGEYQIAQMYLEEALAINQEADKKPGISSALTNLGMIAEHQCDFQKAEVLWEEALALERELGERKRAASLLNNLGHLFYHQYQYMSAEIYFHEALTLQKETGDTRGIAVSLKSLGETAFDQGNYEVARKFFQESLALRQKLGERRGIAALQCSLGMLSLILDQHQEAHQILEESLSQFREIGDQSGIADALNCLAGLAYYQGKSMKAKQLYEESLAILRGLNDTVNVASTLISLSRVAQQQNEYDSTKTLLREGIALACSLSDWLYIAYSLEESAILAMVHQQQSKAVELMGAAANLIDKIQHFRQPNEAKRYRDAACKLRAALGDAAFKAAWEQGRAMNWEEAVAFALEEVLV